MREREEFGGWKKNREERERKVISLSLCRESPRARNSSTLYKL